MKPILFDGCFGWLHPASGSRGVVLCNAYGQEAIWTHKGLRWLAEHFAGAGLPTLRFDYFGTGDSAGDERDPAGLEAWLDSVKAAVRLLKETTGVTEVTLVGLRLGASLAALAAEQLDGVDGLVMLAPVISGKSYLREMRVMHQTWQSGVDVEPSREAMLGDCVEVIGHVLYPAMVAQLGTLDLKRVARAPARRVLIVDRLERASSALADSYRALGCEVETRPFEDCDRFIIESVYSRIPIDVFEKVVSWVAQGSVPRCTPELPWTRAEHPRLDLGHAIETPVCVGKGMFGVLCEPTHAVPRAPTVLFANTGAAHHVGDGRLAVMLARRLANRGIASLRLDINGLGDSEDASWTSNMDVLYTHQSIEDVGEATDWLAAQGHDRVVLCGVCSGAYIGLHAAAANDHVVGLLSINLARFFWPEGMSLENATSVRRESTRLFMRSAMSIDKWRLVFQGRANFTGKVSVVCMRLLKRMHTQLLFWGAQYLGLDVGTPGRVWELVRALEARQIEARLIYGAFDAGLDELAAWFGARGKRLGKLNHVRVSVLDKVDHALFAATARERIMAFVENYFVETFLRDASAANAVKAPSGHEEGRRAVVGAGRLRSASTPPENGLDLPVNC